jgi:hypothetical protein
MAISVLMMENTCHFFYENANWVRDFGQMQISHGVDIQAP